LPVYDIDWNRDGRTLLSAGGDGTIRLWDSKAVGPFGKLSSVTRRSNKSNSSSKKTNKTIYLSAILLCSDLQHCFIHDNGISTKLLKRQKMGEMKILAIFQSIHLSLKVDMAEFQGNTCHEIYHSDVAAGLWSHKMRNRIRHNQPNHTHWIYKHLQVQYGLSESPT